MSEALYRKYRPQIFEDVVGQEHIERTLKNAIASDKVSHAYLFTGPRGTGKTTTARLLSKALICEKGPTPDPDGTCEDCQLIADGEHPDVYELDAASRTGVENVREEIIGRVNYAPTRGRYKVYIIDEVHMLSVAAFNALLKTLEEPPAHVVFILCTTDPQKVPETIHSRCQRFDFRRISSEEMISRLGAICEMEGISDFEGDALDLIAHRAQGGMRDALTSLEQLIAFGEGKVTMEQAERLLGSLDSSDLADIVEAIGKRDAAACFRWTTEYMETGADLAQFTQDLAAHVRDMYVLSLSDAEVALELTEAARREIETELAWFGPDRLSRMLCVLDDLSNQLKTSTNQRLSFEVALTRMVRPDSDLTIAALAERVETLEHALAGGVISGMQDAPSVRASNPQMPQSTTAQTPAVGASAASAPREVPSVVQPAANVSEQPVHVEQAQATATSPENATVASPVASQSSAQQSAPAAQSSAQKDTPVSQPSSFAAAEAGQLWRAVFAYMKQTSAPLGVVFQNAQPSFDSTGTRFVLTFGPNDEFYFNAAQNPEARDALRQALMQAGAAEIAFDIALSKTPLNGTVSPAATLDASAASAPTSVTTQTPTPATSTPTATPTAAASAPATPREPDGVTAATEMPPDIFDDQVPLSAYEDVPPWEDEALPPLADGGLSGGVSAPEASSPAETPTPAPSQQADQSSAAQSDPADLNQMLTSAFGEGITFEEV